MKREGTTTSVATKVAAGEVCVETASPWLKTDTKAQAPFPPPVWTRYIDSRLKQFCAR